MKIICPHCTNDDMTMINIDKIIKGSNGHPDRIIYHCENCAKNFEMKQ